ncbi:response regulator [Belliella kenyensis]|uniref:Response regulator n=1 Tax=Belliella kenyensis TaxID=1472724 RepID=A0ABV8EPZ9_9BACT|nr:response regulator [Belliella kenyensis]MCH7402276.1 response regulator [Belliella kenyensis]MDN3601792.1 response regulator [Belliella kenyensis]
MKDLKNMRAFIVDDDPFWTAILQQLLEGLGFTKISTFESGEACIENIHLNPALIFLDYQMGKSNGLDVLQQVKAYYPEIEVVFCTALEDLQVAISAIEFGSAEYLLKANATEEQISEIIENFQKSPIL